MNHGVARHRQAAGLGLSRGQFLVGASGPRGLHIFAPRSLPAFNSCRLEGASCYGYIPVTPTTLHMQVVGPS